ncbi:ATP-binding protein [Streptomyces sp. NPDC002055]|uniref:ATP-binding protein n=1 Tax=Streptomyces sp. NPDC002055 TaxID=3154534 RepID=UPI003332F727
MSKAPQSRNSLMLADIPNAVGLARLHTADVLSRWGVHAGIAETVQLLVSELATNAVRHPKEGEEDASPFSVRNTVQTFELALEIIGDAVRVSVWDRDTRPPVLKQVGVEATGGRGIFIVAVMSRRWGHYPARGMPGKVVWAEIGLNPANRVGEDERSARSPDRPPISRPREAEDATSRSEPDWPRARRGRAAHLSRGRDRRSQPGAPARQGALLLGTTALRRSADGERRRAGGDSRDAPPPPGRFHSSSAVS